MRHPVFVTVVCALLAPLLFAQQPYIETFELRLHNLDVVVTDRDGKPVRGLAKEDFVVLEDGVRQEITNFSAYDMASGRAVAAARDAEGEAAVEEEQPAPPPRKFVFFVDEIGVQKAARKRLVEQIVEFVRTMRPTDRATIVQPTSETNPVQEFTGPGAALESALAKAIETSGVKLTAGTFPEIFEFQRTMARSKTTQEWRYARRAYADAARRRVDHRLGQITALANSLAGQEGRKLLVVISMGLSTQPGREAWDYFEQMASLTPHSATDVDNESEGDDPERVQGSNNLIGDYTAQIRDMARKAAANGVTIYALEPDVPMTFEIRGRADIPVRFDEKTGHAGNDPRAELPPEFQDELLQNSALTLDAMTEATGGRWFRGMGSIDDAFEQISGDLSVYYSMAYRVSSDSDQARKVEVSVRNRPDLRVRTRNEVMTRSVDREMEDLVVASLLYPRQVDELEVEVEPGEPVPARGFFTIPFDVVIPLRNLTFVPDGEGYVATFSVHFAAVGVRSDFASGGARRQQIEISSEQYEELETTTYRYRTGLEVGPGRMRIAIGILDETSHLTGFETIEVMAE